MISLKSNCSLIIVIILVFLLHLIISKFIFIFVKGAIELLRRFKPTNFMRYFVECFFEHDSLHDYLNYMSAYE